MSISDITTAIRDFLFNHLVQFIFNLMNIVLSPINAIILKLFPDANSLLPYIYGFFDTIKSYVVFALDTTFINSLVFDYLIISIIFRVTAKATAYSVKLAVKWWHAIAP